MRTLLFCIITALCFLCGIVLIKKEPRRIVNGFVLEAGLFSLLCIFMSKAQGGNLWYKISEVFIYLYYIVIFLLGIILIADTVTVIKKEGKSLPNTLPFAFGALAFIVAYAGYRDITSGISGSKTYVKIMSVLNNFFLYVPLAIGAVLIYSIVYLLLKKSKSPTILLCLGAVSVRTARSLRCCGEELTRL